MSKIGNKSISMSKKTIINIKNNIIYIKGPVGSLSLFIKYVNIKLIENKIIVRALNKKNKYKKYHGLYRSLINNMVLGVNHIFKKELILHGVGYRINIENNILAFSIGFSHIVYKSIPRGISVNIGKQNKSITITGINKELVGSYASQLRSIRPPECYLGKGIRYSDEIIIKKVRKN